ncbi:unnamed protein product [Owenia fusiformis]|uniref:Uncharacterized protein n=1 Tax=Owenia fusiformis TaxID=6347 RepID=A0A8J1U0E0_OWEFU|nr:unnamed protein product [Owenia fusiformis]
MDDILEEANRRQQRRLKTPLGKEDPDLGLQGMSISPRSAKGSRNNTRESLTPTERPRTGRRRTTSREQELTGLTEDLEQKYPPLPFIKCKCNGRELKALLNTSSPFSTISTDAVKVCRLEKSTNNSLAVANGINTNGLVKNVQLEFAEKLSIDLYVHDDGPDLCLGLDFLKNMKCVINFQIGSITMNSKDITFLPEREIPLKYRNGKNVSASF